MKQHKFAEQVEGVCVCFGGGGVGVCVTPPPNPASRALMQCKVASVQKIHRGPRTSVISGMKNRPPGETGETERGVLFSETRATGRFVVLRRRSIGLFLVFVVVVFFFFSCGSSKRIRSTCSQLHRYSYRRWNLRKRPVPFSTFVSLKWIHPPDTFICFIWSVCI